jgi:PAS domain-containing protein
MLQKEQWIASFNGITDIVMIIDPDYDIEFANSAFCDFFEVNNPQEVIGRKCYSACHDMSERCDFCPAQNTRESGKIITIEKELRQNEWLQTDNS